MPTLRQSRQPASRPRLAKRDIPLVDKVFKSRPRRPAGVVNSRVKGGQGVQRSRPAKKKLSPINLAWMAKFGCLAKFSKKPDPHAFNLATAQTKDSGWYYRDMIHAAMSGNLFQDGMALKVMTPTARVKRIVAQAMTNGADTYMIPTAKDWDTNVFWSATVNPTRLTVRTPGLYLVGARMIWSATTGGIRYTEMRLNRTSPITKNSIPGSNASTIEQPLVSIWYFNAGDYFEMVGFANVAGVTCALGEFWIVGIDPTTTH